MDSKDLKVQIKDWKDKEDTEDALEGVGKEGFCTRLVTFPWGKVGTGMIFLDVVPVSTDKLAEICRSKKVDMGDHGIPNNVVSLGGKLQGRTEEMVPKDPKFGWGILPILVELGPEA